MHVFSPFVPEPLEKKNTNRCRSQDPKMIVHLLLFKKGNFINVVENRIRLETKSFRDPPVLG